MKTPNQITKKPTNGAVHIEGKDLLSTDALDGGITLAGVQGNLDVGLGVFMCSSNTFIAMGMSAG